MDPQAPSTLSKEERAKVLNEDEGILECKRVRDVCLAEIKSRFETVKKAHGSPLLQEYERAKIDLKAETVAACRDKINELRAKYFADSHKQNLVRQLNGDTAGLDSSHPDIPTNKTLVFSERAQVANAFFFTGSLSEVELLVRRETISNLVALCHLREPARESQPSKKQEKSSDVEMIIGPNSLKILSTQCLFCFSDESFPPTRREKCFARPGSLRRHVDIIHLPHFDGSCPHQSCQVRFENLEHFKNHAAKIHGCAFSA